MLFIPKLQSTPTPTKNLRCPNAKYALEAPELQPTGIHFAENFIPKQRGIFLNALPVLQRGFDLRVDGDMALRKSVDRVSLAGLFREVEVAADLVIPVELAE